MGVVGMKGHDMLFKWHKGLLCNIPVLSLHGGLLCVRAVAGTHAHVYPPNASTYSNPPWRDSTHMFLKGTDAT